MGALHHIVITDQEIISETAEVLRVPSSDISIHNRKSISANITYSAKINSGGEYNCLIRANDYRLHKKLLNPPKCIIASNNIGQSNRLNLSEKRKTTDQRVDKLIRKTKNKRLNEQIESATPFLQEFLTLCACTFDGDDFRRYASRYTTREAMMMYALPITYMKYHNKNSCLTIDKIYDIKSLSQNALSLKVLYSSKDSGENSVFDLEIIQLDNDWLASSFGR